MCLVLLAACSGSRVEEDHPGAAEEALAVLRPLMHSVDDLALEVGMVRLQVFEGACRDESGELLQPSVERVFAVDPAGEEVQRLQSALAGLPQLSSTGGEAASSTYRFTTARGEGGLGLTPAEDARLIVAASLDAPACREAE